MTPAYNCSEPSGGNSRFNRTIVFAVRSSILRFVSVFVSPFTKLSLALLLVRSKIYHLPIVIDLLQSSSRVEFRQFSEIISFSVVP